MSAGMMMMEESMEKRPINYLSQVCYLPDDSAAKCLLSNSSGAGSERAALTRLSDP